MTLQNTTRKIFAFATISVFCFGVSRLKSELHARYHLLRNEHGRAAGIYESLLARHPFRVQYFSRLAHIYLQEGRRDESAMKIYRTVLHFNLASKDREELNTLVAQHYLSEGRTDSDAIEVLEKQLAVEMNRKKLTHA